MDQDPILARKSSILYVVNLGTSRYSKKNGYLVTPPIQVPGYMYLSTYYFYPCCVTYVLYTNPTLLKVGYRLHPPSILTSLDVRITIAK
eukprot:SAG11_NODE_29261_length_312_cov_4.164319_1_plen_89_part_00